VQVVAIDAQAQPQVADEWGVLGLPTTFIIDRARQVRRVNHGVVRADQLRQQIEAVGQWYTQAGRETT
jgi:thioredoxin-like negative regulator of GroEL